MFEVYGVTWREKADVNRSINRQKEVWRETESLVSEINERDTFINIKTGSETSFNLFSRHVDRLLTRSNH